MSVVVTCRYDDTTLDVALNQFQATKSHISLVQHVDNTDPDRDPFPVTTGVVTMEASRLLCVRLPALTFARISLFFSRVNDRDICNTSIIFFSKIGFD